MSERETGWGKERVAQERALWPSCDRRQAQQGRLKRGFCPYNIFMEPRRGVMSEGTRLSKGRN
jgi:hypothetical protein